MNSRELHGPDCSCSECTFGEAEFLIDITSSIQKDQVYALNEKVQCSCQNIFKSRDNIKDKTDYIESNDNDPDLLIYIPFNSQVKVRAMRMIGGEDGTSPREVKLYVNRENVDFDLVQVTPEQTIQCVENEEGELAYTVSPNKFNSVWSITMLVTKNYNADHTKIYSINFEGVSSKKRKKVYLKNAEVQKFADEVKPPEENVNQDLIYG